MTLSPRDIIADAIWRTQDGKYTFISFDHSIRARRLVAQHALDALSEAGYTVVPTAEYEELQRS